MEFISSVFNYFADAGNKLSHKTMLTFSIIVIVLIVDNTLNFSGHYNNSRKYEQIEVINRILVDSTVNLKDKALLKQKRADLLTSKTWKDKAYDYVFSIELNPSKEPSTSSQPVSPKEQVIVQKERTYWLHFVSSSWIFTIMIFVLPFIPFFSKSNDRKSTALGVLAMIPVLFLLSWVFAKGLSYIPIILNEPVYNYVLNALIHCISLFSLVMIIGKREKSKDSYTNINDLVLEHKKKYEEDLN